MSHLNDGAASRRGPTHEKRAQPPKQHDESVFVEVGELGIPDEDDRVVEPTGDERVRGRLAVGTAVFIGGMLSVAMIGSFVTGDWHPVLVVWSIVGPIAGAIFGYYFGQRPGGKNGKTKSAI